MANVTPSACEALSAVAVVAAVNGGEIVARSRLKSGIRSAIRASGLNFENVLF